MPLPPFIAATLLLLVLSAPARADTDGTADLAGAGLLTCGDAVAVDERIKRSERETYRRFVFSWVQGFISGLNYRDAEQNERVYSLGSLPTAKQIATVFAFCRDNPNALVREAALELAGSLRRRKPR